MVTRHAEVHRHIEPRLRHALDTFRVVVLGGPRQSGKTTLAHRIVGSGTYLNLDDPTVRSFALDDPTGFIADRPRPIVIDEVQRGGDDLVRAVKLAVDADPTPGGFLLTGSTSFLTVPVFSESLAGRAVFFDLAPFSQIEMEGSGDGLLPRLLDGTPDRTGAIQELLHAAPSTASRADYAERICRGGYPEAISLGESDRRLWFDAYVHTAVTRDIVEVTGARRSTELARLLRAAAARTASELVMRDVHRDLELGSIDTTADYLSYLEMTHLVTRLGGWATGAATRAKRRPKIHVNDTGLATALLGLTAESLNDPASEQRGPLHETFAVNELRRQASAMGQALNFSHYRDSRGREVDLLIERPDGRIIAVEIKAGATVRPTDAKWLAWLRDLIGDRFEAGLVLYTGSAPLPVADRVVALPLSYLWET
ncbi:ATP-binding protein [Candidatus Poriferisodalis sp.]|uniref:ATP-binding protein n=1 Tax=Candidatus Poriferisodalis sp. TaxID=3101277 RepID=UPI003B0175DB